MLVRFAAAPALILGLAASAAQGQRSVVVTVLDQQAWWSA